MSLYALPPSGIKDAIIQCFQANLVPMVHGSPGSGKSQLVQQIADEYNLELIDVRLSQMEPTDLMGLPMRIESEVGPKSAFIPFNTFPTEEDSLPADKEGWVLFLDEFNSASKATEAAAYKLVLDRMVGQANLHPNVFIVAAGNKATDRAIVTRASTAMQSRLIHFEMEVSHQEWMDYASKNDIDYRIVAFLQHLPDKLMDFIPDHDDKTFASPRTWEFLSRLIKDKDEISLPIAAGAIGTGVATEFHSFIEVFDKIPKYNDIVAKPEAIELPDDPGSVYATIMMLVQKFEKNTFDKVALYVERFSPEMQIFYFRQLNNRHPSFRKNKTFLEMRKKVSRFLLDDAL